MKFRIQPILFFLIMIFFSFNSIAGESFLVRSYSIPDHGKILLKTPIKWKSSFSQPAGGLPPTITIAPVDKNIFIRATTFWNVKNVPDFNSPEALKKMAYLVGNRLLPRTIESKIELIDINGSKNKGYYYTITDKNPKPGEYTYMSQGYIAVNDLVLAFTILSHEKMSDNIETAIIMLKEAGNK